MDDLYVFKKQDFINLLDEISENNTKEMLQKTDIEKTQLSEEDATSDCISRREAKEVADAIWSVTGDKNVAKVWDQLKDLPSTQPEREDYTETKREFLRMASYIDSLLVCSDEQKETLMNFISRIADDMPWTERD